MEALLRAEDVHLRYGEASALRGASISVQAGELVALLGANGAGKTSLLKAISGLVRPSQGQIMFDGLSIVAKPAHRIVALGLSHVEEGRGIYGEMTVLENLRLGMYLKGEKHCKAALQKALALFPVLERRIEQFAGTLSGGEQQMLAIARSLVGQPRLLMVDELSLGLSPKIAGEIMDTLVKLKQEGQAILIVEQSAAQALRYADRIHVMAQGQTVFSGSAEEARLSGILTNAYLGRD